MKNGDLIFKMAMFVMLIGVLYFAVGGRNYFTFLCYVVVASVLLFKRSQ